MLAGSYWRIVLQDRVGGRVVGDSTKGHADWQWMGQEIPGLCEGMASAKRRLGDKSGTNKNERCVRCEVLTNESKTSIVVRKRFTQS